jgi:hypothetical protein
VLLRSYSEGNTLRGDHASVAWDITGVVIETPRSGSNYLVIKPDPAQSLPSNVFYDEDDREAYSISADRVALRRTEFWQWTCDVLAPPAPAEPLVPQIGDRVSYVPQRLVLEDPTEADKLWASREHRVYTVVDLYERGNGIVDARCWEVLPARNRHNATQPDWFHADLEHLRIVERATYTKI